MLIGNNLEIILFYGNKEGRYDENIYKYVFINIDCLVKMCKKLGIVVVFREENWEISVEWKVNLDLVIRFYLKGLLYGGARDYWDRENSFSFYL